MIAICKQAVDTYGKTHQIVICAEELAGLIKELSKNVQGLENLPQIAEKVANVEIMLEQIKIIFDLHKAVSNARLSKLRRLQALLDKSE
mgnify:CR=1 FL=1